MERTVKLVFRMWTTMLALSTIACTKSTYDDYAREGNTAEVGANVADLRMVAKLIAESEMGPGQLKEVSDAVCASSGNGYDEEYMLRDLLSSPGAGVGDNEETKATKAGLYDTPLKSLLEQKLKAALSGDLSKSDLQIYWPYSDSWDGKTMPVVTFDPGYGAESNWGYVISKDGVIVDSILVDESIAQSRPVWVINRNDDSGFTPMSMSVNEQQVEPELTKAGEPSKEGGLQIQRQAKSRILSLKSFKMLRNYDSWFGGASEFFIKCGGVDGFTATTEAEMRLYTPSVSDFMIVVRRSEKNKEKEIGSIMMTNFTNQIEQIAFLITEDDGGTTTSWKCSAVVKVASKSYGFELDIPYKDKDDIVWRGQLASTFLQSEDEVSGRFGDVIVTFALE